MPLRIRKRRGTCSLITCLHGSRAKRGLGMVTTNSAGFGTPNAQIQLTNEWETRKLRPQEGSVLEMSFRFLWDQDTVWVSLLGSFLVLFTQVIFCPASLFSIP